MTDDQINGVLSLALGTTYAAAWIFYLVLEARSAQRAKARGWWAICGAAGLGAAAWNARHAGSALEILAWGAGGALTMWIVLCGGEARARMSAAMFDPARRAGSRDGHRRPKDFAGL
jgi:hypothetical protein